MPKKITDHFAKAGPMYWSWRCLVCGEPVNEHQTPISRVWDKIRRR